MRLTKKIFLSVLLALVIFQAGYAKDELRIPVLNLAFNLAKGKVKVAKLPEGDSTATLLADAILYGARKKDKTNLMVDDSVENGYEEFVNFTGAYRKYLSRYGDKSPMFPGFNGGFGKFLKRELEWSDDDSQLHQNYLHALTSLVLIMQQNPSNRTQVLEATADILVNMKRSPESNYVAAYIYYTCGQIAADEKSKEVFDRKAAFVMERKLGSPPRYNQARWIELRQIADELLETWDGKGSFVNHSVADLRMDSLSTFGGLWLFNNQKEGKLLDFINDQVTYELVEAGKIPPNQDFINPSMDPSTVKSNLTFNTYALGIIAVLLLSVALIWFRFRRAERKLRETDQS